MRDHPGAEVERQGASRFLVLYSQPHGSKKQRQWRDGSLRVGFATTTLYDTEDHRTVVSQHGSGSTPNKVFQSMTNARSGSDWDPLRRAVNEGGGALVLTGLPRCDGGSCCENPAEVWIGPRFLVQILEVMELHLLPYDRLPPLPDSPVDVGETGAADAVCDFAEEWEADHPNTTLSGEGGRAEQGPPPNRTAVRRPLSPSFRSRALPLGAAAKVESNASAPRHLPSERAKWQSFSEASGSPRREKGALLHFPFGQGELELSPPPPLPTSTPPLQQHRRFEQPPRRQFFPLSQQRQVRAPALARPKRDRSALLRELKNSYREFF